MIAYCTKNRRTVPVSLVDFARRCDDDDSHSNSLVKLETNIQRIAQFGHKNRTNDCTAQKRTNLFLSTENRLCMKLKKPTNFKKILLKKKI